MESGIRNHFHTDHKKLNERRRMLTDPCIPLPWKLLINFTKTSVQN